MTQYILFGAGTTGRVVARQLNAAGNPAVQFADNDSGKWDTEMEGVFVSGPLAVQMAFPDAVWIATAMQPRFREELLDQIETMGVKSESLWEFMPKRHSLPSGHTLASVARLLADVESEDEWLDQIALRRDPDIHRQRPCSDISEIYFPDWITRRDDEHYVDCGAADGDTIREFLKRWDKWGSITAFEPDRKNWDKCYEAFSGTADIHGRLAAVSDVPGLRSFTETGDYSAHLGDGDWKTACVRLDDEIWNHAPTFIKMDIEGSELEALWGARRILREHSPVLAICAYHTADHLWQIPLLIHAIQPDYKLFFRRYAEGTWELVWYAVPPEREK